MTTRTRVLETSSASLQCTRQLYSNLVSCILRTEASLHHTRPLSLRVGAVSMCAARLRAAVDAHVDLGALVVFDVIIQQCAWCVHPVHAAADMRVVHPGPSKAVLRRRLSCSSSLSVCSRKISLSVCSLDISLSVCVSCAWWWKFPKSFSWISEGEQSRIGCECLSLPSRDPDVRDIPASKYLHELWGNSLSLWQPLGAKFKFVRCVHASMYVGTSQVAHGQREGFKR